MSAAGRALELALIRGARAYRQAGRKVLLIRQHAAMVPSAGGGLVYSDVGAPVDLIGGVDGVPWGIEAKMTSRDALPLDERRRGQRAVLDLMLACGFHVRLCVEFTAHHEVYSIPWDAVAVFERAAWRRSLSLSWCRAFGLLVPEEHADDEARRSTRFLDGAPHAEQRAAIDAVNADHAARAGRAPAPGRPGKRQRAIAERIATGPRPSDGEAYREHLRGIVSESIGRQLGRTRGRGTGWKGGR